MVNDLSKLFWKKKKKRFPNNFSKTINYVIVEFWFRYTFMHKFLEANIIFVHQPTVLAIEHLQRFTKFMITIALFKELGG